LFVAIVTLSPVDGTVDNAINFEISYRNVTLPKDQSRLNTLLMESHERKSKSEDSDIESSSLSQESENEADDLMTDVTDCMDKTTNLRTELRTLIIENNISHNTVNKLVFILRKYGQNMGRITSDVRVLLQTPRNASINFKVIGNDHYVHFGLFSALERSIQILAISKNEKN